MHAQKYGTDSPRLYLPFFSSSPTVGVDSWVLAVSSFSFSLSASAPPLPPPSSSSPSSPSSSLSSSASLSGAPNGFAGLSLLMIGGCPGEAKLPVLGPAPPSALENGLPPPKPLPKPPVAGLAPFMAANGDGAEASLLPKLSFGGLSGVDVEAAVAGGAPKLAKGDGEAVAPPPNTLLVVPTAAKGEAEDVASLAKPESANLEGEVCSGRLSLAENLGLEASEVVWR